MESVLTDLTGKTAIITGATSGIGKETAIALAGKGATVVLACRNVSAALVTAAEIRECHPGSQVEVGPPLDLEKLDSIRKFAAAYQEQRRPLHILVNNAGANIKSKWHTPEGIAGLVQINYLGPYALTRLLEPSLIASAPSRVVNVSSIMHRCGSFQDPAHFLRDTTRYQYDNTKLANVLFTYEHQRRLGPLGVQSCAVDPGSVRSNIWKGNAAHQRPPISWVVNYLYAPISDGASAVIHAACADWAQPAKRVAAGQSQPPPPLRFYARGLFTSPGVTYPWTVESGLLGTMRYWAWGLSAIGHSMLDWHTRRLTKGRFASQTKLQQPLPVTPAILPLAASGHTRYRAYH
ncbi:hypothetical protein WJX72_011450 [[Myrmecia] bisecta]|uniref:Uncharacterized protein n=1 Tax=[Myrmecia] bisecta TaxID=41462 RepID=A0AAW1P3N2_9CHLO